MKFLKRKKFMNFYKRKKSKEDDNKDHLKKDNQDDGKQDENGQHTYLTEDMTSIIEKQTSATQTHNTIPTSLLLLKGLDDLVGVSWSLEQPLTSVGRSFRLNDITISHTNLSKVHLQILKEKEQFYLVDLKSTNKTYLNEQEIEPYKKYLLKDNDYVRASSVVFKFLAEGNIEGVSSKQILNKASTDSLTGVGNRELLKIKGKDYFNSEILSLIVFDVDDFKAINDGLGHSAGDYVLRMVAKSILEVTRDNDLVIRYGGDEFCILSPEPVNKSHKIAERIRYKIENMNLYFDNQNIHTRISIGVAGKIKSDKSWEDIYHRADKLSYKEKNQKKLKKI